MYINHCVFGKLLDK